MAAPPESAPLEVVQQPLPAHASGDIPESSTPAQPLSLRALLASKPYDPCVLFKGEHYWRDRSLWLKEHGYTLRPRYSPDWKPSWIGTSKRWMDCEDSCAAPGVCIMTSRTDIVRDVDNGVIARPCLGRNS